MSALTSSRTIPTRVGNTSARSSFHIDSSDHPHARGEYIESSNHVPRVLGPSPRAWGIPSRGVYRLVAVRTIPTRVGNTRFSCAVLSIHADHPHARGEYSRMRDVAPDRSGPSPRAWGIRVRNKNPVDRGRTIPTRVGNTIEKALTEARLADHPHARGEYLTEARLAFPACGPSPRAWGIPPFPSRRLKHRRTIPTRVGNTLPFKRLS